MYVMCKEPLGSTCCHLPYLLARTRIATPPELPFLMSPLGTNTEGHCLERQHSGRQCAYCGRITRHWILASGGRVCVLPRPESCRDICSIHGWKVFNDMKIKRHANGRFAPLSKSHIRVLDGLIGTTIASFLCKV